MQRVQVIAQLAEPSGEASAAASVALIAASADPLHAAELADRPAHWRHVLDETERRARAGMPLTVARLRELGAISDDEALVSALTPGGAARSILLRAVAASAALETGPLAQLVPLALLSAGGLLSHARLLPFGLLQPAEREDLLVQWRAGEQSQFTQATLGLCALAARSGRVAVQRALAAKDGEEELLTPLGRASHTARRALAVLHQRLAITMPALADALDCSRPAAGDALDRLTDIGLATEITGRARDRVFAWTPAWSTHAA